MLTAARTAESVERAKVGKKTSQASSGRGQATARQRHRTAERATSPTNAHTPARPACKPGTAHEPGRKGQRQPHWHTQENTTVGDASYNAVSFGYTSGRTCMQGGEHATAPCSHTSGQFGFPLHFKRQSDSGPSPVASQCGMRQPEHSGREGRHFEQKSAYIRDLGRVRRGETAAAAAAAAGVAAAYRRTVMMSHSRSLSKTRALSQR